MRLEPGMRVRCVDANYTDCIGGAEYIVASVHEVRYDQHLRIRLRGSDESFYHQRFKPIVRVKAGSLRV